jgi:hypothetical protein
VEGNLQINDELTIGNMRYQVKWGAEPEQTLAATGPKNGIKPAKPTGRNGDSMDSNEEPVPLPDMSLSKVPQSIPAPKYKNSSSKSPANVDASNKPSSLDFPDDIQLVPLSPPPK